MEKRVLPVPHTITTKDHLANISYYQYTKGGTKISPNRVGAKFVFLWIYCGGRGGGAHH